MKKELHYAPFPNGRELDDLREIAQEMEEKQAGILAAVMYGYSWGIIEGKRRERRRRLSSKFDMLPEREKQLVSKIVGWLASPSHLTDL